MTTALAASSAALTAVLSASSDLRTNLAPICDLLAERRRLDLSDLAAPAQADLIARRACALLPSLDDLTARLGGGAELVVKFGIDPTSPHVHVGHAVPMLVASRLQRMGHRLVFIVGDVTARIGDPSGRSADRPVLSEADVAANLATYRQQVTPFIDFASAEFRFNRDWLGQVTVPQFLSVLERLPVSAALQRDDFRSRLSDGSGLSMAEFVYSVVMALDSMQVHADIEIGGVDQLLNMQMCRRVMSNAGQRPEVVVTTALIEGTDGTGAKMSKSKGNTIALAAEASDVFGGLMSIPDRLVPGYLAALTELLDPEIAMLAAMPPMAVKMLLANDVTAAIHGTDAAGAAADGFIARFSRRRFSDAAVPVIARSRLGTSTIADLFVAVTGIVPSANQVRRIAAGGGLRVITESSQYGQQTVTLSAGQANEPAVDVVAVSAGRTFVRCGRAVVELA